MQRWAIIGLLSKGTPHPPGGTVSTAIPGPSGSTQSSRAQSSGPQARVCASPSPGASTKTQITGLRLWNL